MNNKSYNTFLNSDELEIKILSYLSNNNNNIFRLLNSNKSNALDLEIDDNQKTKLMPPFDMGSGYNEDTRIFLSPYIDDGFSEVQTHLRIYEAEGSPDNLVITRLKIGFDVLCHKDIVLLNGYKNRYKTLRNEILNTLNGVNIGGLGEIRFVRGNRMNVVNFNDAYLGYRFTMTQFLG